MSAQTVKAFHANLSLFHTKNWLLWQSPLTEVHQIFNHMIFFIDGVKTTIRVEIRAPVVE